MSSLTAIILTLNEAAHITACIESLAWADRVVVFDSLSSDATVALAREAGAEIHERPFDNYAAQRNAALDSVQADWVFFVDADERATPELAAEIRRVMDERRERGWFVPRHNYIFGRLTLGAGWYPDYQLRLLRHGFVRYARPVHEVAEVDGATGYLENPLIHYNYHDRTQFHETQRRYVAYDAGLMLAGGERPRPHNFVLQPLRHFWWRFGTLGGHRDGGHGLELSAYMAYYEWRKYRVLSQLWREQTDRPGSAGE